MANLINLAALKASSKKQPAINHQDLEEARDTVLMGAERKSLVRTKEELTNTAYHEVCLGLLIGIILLSNASCV